MCPLRSSSASFNWRTEHLKIFIRSSKSDWTPCPDGTTLRLGYIPSWTNVECDWFQETEKITKRLLEPKSALITALVRFRTRRGRERQFESISCADVRHTSRMRTRTPNSAEVCGSRQDSKGLAVVMVMSYSIEGGEFLEQLRDYQFLRSRDPLPRCVSLGTAFLLALYLRPCLVLSFIWTRVGCIARTPRASGPFPRSATDV